MRNNRNILFAVLTVSVLLRLAAAAVLGDRVVELPGTADQVSYHTLALRVLGGHGFSFGQGWWPLTQAGAPTAHWSFLYTFYLVGVYGLFGPHPIAARIIQALLVGILHPMLVYWLGRRVFGAAAGLIAAGFTAVYAYFIYYAGALMTEPFFITSVLALLYCAVRFADLASETGPRGIRRWLGWGLLLGLAAGAAVLLRQLILLFLPFLIVWIGWSAWRQHSFRRSLAGIALALGVLAVMILPFTAYNYTRFGRFVLLNTNSGYAFFWSNHPSYGTRFVPILTDQQYLSMIPADLKNLDEAALDQALMARGIQYVAGHPADFLLLSLSRIPVYFMFWPSPDSGLLSNITRVSSFGVFWPFMLAGFVLALRRPRGAPPVDWTSPVALLVLFAGVFSLVHIFSWALIRYRLPVDAVMLVFSGQAALELARWFGQRNLHLDNA
ncbi:MAG TPA: glycosyltransferase family 39 protein [Anaerolineaceae bacterium]